MLCLFVIIFLVLLSKTENKYLVVRMPIEPNKNQRKQVQFHSEDTKTINTEDLGDDYKILINGSVYDSSIYNGCDEDLFITGDMIDTEVFNRGSLDHFGDDYGLFLNGNIFGGRIVSTCEHDLEIQGDVFDAEIFHGKVQTFKGNTVFHIYTGLDFCFISYPESFASETLNIHRI
jgi:hypothetical protein